MSGDDPVDPLDVLEVTDITPGRLMTIGQLAVGQAVIQRVLFTAPMRDAFDAVARDRAPVHDDPRFARAAGFDRPIIQGLCVVTRFSRLIGMYLPGEAAILQTVAFKYRRPVYADTELVYCARIRSVSSGLRTVAMALSIAIEGVEHVSGDCRVLVR